jgi:hypothetical protein
MKFLKIAIPVLAGLLIGLGLSSLNASKANAELTKQLAALQVSLEQSEQARSNAVVQRDQSKNEADQLRQRSDEVHRLRAEVSALKRDVATAQVVEERTARAPKRAEPADPLPDKLKAGAGVLSLENAPPVIQAALLREIGGVPSKGFLGSSIDKDGNSTFSFKGQSGDGKSIALRMAADGSVLEKSAEIATSAVPASIQNPVAQAFGRVTITGAREVFEGGNIRYELTGRSPEAGVQVTVDADGAILSYSAKLQPPDKEQRDQKVRK